MSRPAITVSDLSKVYRLDTSAWDRFKEWVRPGSGQPGREHWALRSVGFEVPRQQTVGIVGANGAGKSTLLKILTNRLRPTSGRVEVEGRIDGILELGTGLQPTLTGRQNARVNALFMGLDPWRIDQQLERIVAFSELGEYIDQPLETYSSGMKARLAFSVLAAIEPEILVLDEALATGDAGFAEKCTQFVRGLCRSGCTAVLVSHDMHFLTSVCQRLIWIDRGQVRDDGDPERVAASYLESFGELAVFDSRRPRTLTFRIAPVTPGEPLSYAFHCFGWFSPDARSAPAGHVEGDGLFMIQGHYLGYDNAVRESVQAALQAGVTSNTARAPWGAAKQLPEIPGPFRALSPHLGPGGAAYLTLAVPQAPLPPPTAIRVFGVNDLARPLSLSVRVDDEFVPLGEFGTPELARQFGAYRYGSDAFSLAPVLARFDILVAGKT